VLVGFKILSSIEAPDKEDVSKQLLSSVFLAPQFLGVLSQQSPVTVPTLCALLLEHRNA
jgi:hypothetical protein